MTAKKAGSFRVMAINPGSTSTKFGLYDDETCVSVETIRHDAALLSRFGSIPDQKDFRRDCILENLKTAGLDLNSLDAVVGRGGLLKPIESGVYAVNERMLEDLRLEHALRHAATLGAILAWEIAAPLSIPSFIVDPVVVYEMNPVTRLSGIPGVDRVSIFHALNQKAVARRVAAEFGKPYGESRFVVAHLGGGITVGAHCNGRVIDVNDGLLGEGPFSPERAGGVPMVPVIDMCFSGKYTRSEMTEMFNGKGGVKAYLGTSDVTEVLKRIEGGDEFAALVLDAMTYQIAKEIGAMVVALEGSVDAIILTGGIAYSERITGAIKRRVDKLAPVHVFPGEDEIFALVSGALRVLRGTEKTAVYV
jgi:butyrate kinase